MTEQIIRTLRCGHTVETTAELNAQWMIAGTDSPAHECCKQSLGEEFIEAFHKAIEQYRILLDHSPETQREFRQIVTESFRVKDQNASA